MSGICKGPNGLKTIQFSDKELEGRPKIHLGKASLEMAKSVQVRLQALLAAKKTGMPIDNETASWLGKIGSDLHDRLVQLGLTQAREQKPEAIKLKSLIERYISCRQNLAPNTLRNYRATQRILQEYFGKDRVLTTIHAGHASDYREWLAGKYAQPTVSREIKRARQFFEYARRSQIISENPFAEVKAGPQTNPDRQEEIERDAVAAVLQALPDNEHRLVLVLARVAGLRVPSDLKRLTWDCIDWERERFTVRSQKLEQYPTKRTKIVPIFPSLRPYLEQARKEATEGSVYVVPPRFHRDGMFRTALRRAMKRAGIPIWAKPLVNCRASGQTELIQEYPEHVVCAWIGNSEKVAREHYLMVTEAHYARAVAAPTVKDPIAEAVQKAVLPAGVTNGQRQSLEKESAVMPAIADYTAVQVPPRGVEPRFSD
jgi:integrase